MTGQTCFELCTESLGFESGDCSVGEGEEELDLLIPSAPTNDEEKVENVFQQNQDQAREDEIRVEGKRQKSFPPPLRWMTTHAGKQSSYMKSERKDGRLILTEVRIERPEVFQVTREKGRLRFCFPWTEEKVEEEVIHMARDREEEMEPVRREGFCSYEGEWSSNRSMHQWLHHHGFVTTA